MKNILKVFVLSSILITAFTTEASAQSRRTTKDKSATVKTRTTTRTTTRTLPGRRVSSTKVTYRKPTRKVVSVRNIPNRRVIRHGGQNYYYANNRYYTYSRGRYIVISPKVGFRVRTLPAPYKRIYFNNYNYFYAGGIFYIHTNDVYEVVDPEIGTIVYELPDGYEKVEIDGLSYYEYANILYEKVQVDGERAYEVVGIIELE